jgi:hypothetical protein
MPELRLNEKWQSAGKDTVTVSAVLRTVIGSPVAPRWERGLCSLAAMRWPAALLALGCGLTAHFVQKLMTELSDRLSKRRNAQFLAYPFHLEKTLSSSTANSPA